MTRSNAAAWLVAGAISTSLLALTPAPFQGIDRGVDASYVWALNRAAADDLVHGRDIVFNYGPLGYLLFPLDIGTNLGEGLAVHWAMFCLLAVLLFSLAASTTTAAPLVACATTLLFARALDVKTEYLWLLTLGFLLSGIVVHGSRFAAWRSVVAGALAGSLLFVKFALGLTACAMTAVAIVSILGRAPRKLLPAAMLVIGLVGAGATVTVVHFRTLAVLARWVDSSIEITSGYSAAMSLSGSGFELALGLAILACFFGLSLAWLREHSHALSVAIIFLLPLLLAYKHAFVRQATHGPIFFPVAVTAAGMLLAVASRGRERWAAGVLLVSVVLLTLCAVMLRPLSPLRSIGDRVSPVEGLRRAASLMRLGQVRARLAEATQRRLEARRLPPEWMEVIRRDPGGVDVVPYELSYLPANDLPWQPDPVVQTYNAYTARLDRLAAMHFAGPHAPKWLLFHLATIDLRHPLLDAPMTARALLRRYRPVAVNAAEGLVLLRAEGPMSAPASSVSTPRSPSTDHDLTIGDTTARLGDWVEIPVAVEPLSAEMGFTLGNWGRWQALALRAPAVAMEIEYEDGRLLPVRILPDTASGGLPLSAPPTSAAAAADLFAGSPSERAVRFRVGGAGALLYEMEFPVRWRATRQAIFPSD